MYATCHDPKIYPHTKFGIPTSNYIQISSGLDHARTETRGQDHSDLETVGDLPGPKMYLRGVIRKFAEKCYQITLLL